MQIIFPTTNRAFPQSFLKEKGASRRRPLTTTVESVLRDTTLLWLQKWPFHFQICRRIPGRIHCPPYL